MPHKCVKCDTVYDDESDHVVKGCDCGSKVFLYVRKEKFESLKHIVARKDGRYEINVGALFNKSPEVNHTEVVRLEEGKYDIDLAKALRGEE